MQHLGLNSAQLVAYVDALRADAFLVTTVNVLDAAGNPIGPLSSDVSDGQVLVDRNAEVSRLLTLDLADPTGSLEFDPASAADDALWLNNQLQITASVWVESVGDHVECPYFTGPIHRLWRDGGVVHVDAHSKERRMLRPLWSPLFISRDTTKVDAIRQILAQAGETLFALPTGTELLATSVSLARGDRPWRYAQAIAKSMNMQLYYRGDGYAALRELPNEPVFSFTRVDENTEDTTLGDGDVAGAPRVWFELGAQFANTVEILGAPPLANKPRVRGVAYAPEDHPLSRENMATDPTRVETGVLVASHVVPQCRNDDQAKDIAQALIDEHLLGVTRARFDATPFYHLEEGDFVQLDTPTTTVPYRLDRFGLPVGTRGRHVMTVGYHTKTSLDRRQP